MKFNKKVLLSLSTLSFEIRQCYGSLAPLLSSTSSTSQIHQVEKNSGNSTLASLVDSSDFIEGAKIPAQTKNFIGYFDLDNNTGHHEQYSDREEKEEWSVNEEWTEDGSSAFSGESLINNGDLAVEEELPASFKSIALSHNSDDVDDEERRIDIDIISLVEDSENSRKVFFPISSDLFDGKVCILFRRSDDGAIYGNRNDPNGGGAIWEIQLQGKFKRELKGPLYVALEMPQKEEYQTGFVMRRIINGVFRFTRAFHKHFDVSMGGKGKRPHMAFPAFASFDRVISTPIIDSYHQTSNDTAISQALYTTSPPVLGERILETEQSRSARRKDPFNFQVNTKSIYTFSKSSFYFGALDWKVSGIPLVNEIDVRSVTKGVRLHVYEKTTTNDAEFDHDEQETSCASKGHKTAFWIQLQHIGS